MKDNNKLTRAYPGRGRALGFAYVLLLVVVAVLGMFASSSLQLGTQMSRHDAEQALLSAGSEFEHALYSYAGVAAIKDAGVVNAATMTARGPRTLEELLKDQRTAGIRRHLRQVYADPMTGRDDWGLIKDPAGYILGVYSKSPQRPIKQTGFEPAQAHFENAATYSQWVFGLPNAVHASQAPLPVAP